MSNPFLDLFERQAPSPVKAKMRAAEVRRSRSEEKRDEEQSKLSAHYRAARQQELTDALAGRDGDLLRAYLSRLEGMTLESIPVVTAFVRSGGLRAVSADTLFLALRMTSDSICKLRATSGLPPFDDPLPGDPATPEWDLREAFADQQKVNP